MQHVRFQRKIKYFSVVHFSLVLLHVTLLNCGSDGGGGRLPIL